ncbi:MAG: DnaD domain protein [Clostridiales bacterium]|nr:DnaD domain protein [Clostridiales bacterium]
MLVSFSGEYLLDSFTGVDNLFISEYLPQAPDMCVKVYLYGLFLCAHSHSPDNDLEKMARALAMQPSEIIDAYTYWAELGLVSIVGHNPFSVKYLPPKNALSLKKYSVAKYAEFNMKIEAMFDREILPNEFNEYYSLIEAYHFEPEAFLMIVRYCIDLKGGNINYKYISAVARNWANAGITTCERVEQKILEYDKISEELAQVMKALGSRKRADIDERAMYLKWKEEFLFDFDTIIAVAKRIKKGGFSKLDSALTRYYESKLMTIQEIEEFENNKDKLYALARKINRTIGVYYEQLDYIIETYISDWLSKGFEEDALVMIADACFRRHIRTLEGMNGLVNKFYKQGLVSAGSIISHLERLSETDKKIKRIFEVLNIEKNITSWDRDSYRTWTYSWGLSDELILYCAELAKGAASPIAYMNKVLSSWHDQKIATVEQAKQIAAQKGDASKIAKPSTQRTYTQQELNALIDDITKVEF